jgi:hypothetical protein
MFKSYERLIEYLQTEREVYENMIQTLQNLERGKTDIDLKPIEKLDQILESIDVETSSDYTNKRMVQSSIFLNRILRDLIYVVRNSDLSYEAKRKWIEKLKTLLEKAERRIRSYYDYYGVLPQYYRYYDYWYYTDRRRYGQYLPYYDYYQYYYDKYPSKAKQLSDEEVIWKDLTTKQRIRETSFFVPKTFGCDDQSQYDEYTLLKLHNDLQQSNKRTTLSEELDNDELHKIADQIIKESRRMYQK